MKKNTTLRLMSDNTQAISSVNLLSLYRDMVLGRSFEDICAQMYYKGKMFGFVHLYNGQEAVSTGVIKTLSKNDYVCSTYRDHVHALSKGIPPKEIMAELFGKVTGCSKGRGGSMHLFSSQYNFLGGFAFIGEGIPVAIGAAFQSIYRTQVLQESGPTQVTACFFGDGTSNNGQFFECLNMSVLWKLPIIFIVENNQWAIGMAHSRASSRTEIYKKASVFGLPGVEVDGMDVLAIQQVTQEAISRARSGEGPTLIEALTYRFRGHSLADPDELRSDCEKAAWIARDPIKRLRQYIISHQVASNQDLDLINTKIQKDLQDAVDFAMSSPEPLEKDLQKHLFVE